MKFIPSASLFRLLVPLVAASLPALAQNAGEPNGPKAVPPAFEHVGFYTHGGWVFDYPFAPRAWQRADYAAMFGLLQKMGYDTAMIWPLLEAIPMPLTAADRAEIEAFRPTLQDARDAGLRVWLVQCANLTTPTALGSVPWRRRNPYPVMRTIRFDDAAETAEFFAHRAAMLSILNNADGYVTIDGDPGGYAGAAPQDFVKIFLADHATIAAHGTHPARQPVIPWVWCGWGTGGVWSQPVEPFLRAEFEALRGQLPEPWEMLPGRSAPGHGNGRVNMALTAEYGLAPRSTLLFYEAIEYEPVPPAAHLQFELIRSFFKDERALRGQARGVMGNAQQPVMVLPNLFFFARCARDAAYLDTATDTVLDDFAALLGGPAELLRPAWKCLTLPLAELPADLPARLRAARLTGEAAALIPGGPALYLDLLAAQVESRRRMLAAMTLPTATPAQAATAIAEGTAALVAWWERHHFVGSSDPGTPFAWSFVNNTQYDALATWAHASVADKAAVAPLAVQELMQHRVLTEPTATQVVRQLLDVPTP